MAKKRGNQEGTFYQRANGTWCGQVMINNIRYTAYAKGIQECRAKLRQKATEAKNTNTDSELFSSYAERLTQRQLKQRDIRKQTVRVREVYIKEFLEVIGDKSIGSITEADINEYIGALYARGQSPATIKVNIGSILSIIRHAESDGVRTNKIIARKITKIPATNKRRVIPKLETIKDIIKQSNDDLLRVFLYTLLYTGLRGNEAIALKWSDVDLDNHRIFVNRGYSFVNREHIFAPPKSNRIGEFAQFGDELHALLVEYKKSKNFPDDYLFFVQQKASAIVLLRMKFKRLLARNGLTGGFHMLRHLHASLLLQNNIDLKTIQNQLRHSTVITTDKYLHEIDESIRESIKSLKF